MGYRRAAWALVVVAATAPAAGCASAPPAPPAAPSASGLPWSAPAASPPPTLSAAFTIGDVDPSRLLQITDLGSGEYVGHESAMEPGRRAQIVGGLCGLNPASEASVIERATLASSYQLDGRPGGVEEIITRFRAGGAAEYLAEITAGVTACTRVDQSESIWSELAIVATGFAGDDSILIKQDQFSPPTEYSNGHTISYQAVVRGGDAVLIIVVSGWESTNPERQHVDLLVAAAVARASD